MTRTDTATPRRGLLGAGGGGGGAQISPERRSPETSRGPSFVEVDLGGYARNLEAVVAELPKGVALCAVLKADAYGHGATACARTALRHGASMLAVTRTQEALELRQAGIQAKILLLGYHTPDEAPLLVREHITVTLWTVESAQRLAHAAEARSTTTEAHVLVNTGMNRLGVLPGQAPELLTAIRDMRGVHVDGIFTELSAGRRDLVRTRHQAQIFGELLDQLEERGLRPRVAHAADSGGTLYVPESHFDMVRIGAAAFGMMPDFGAPVLSWKTEISHVHQVPAGEGVGYWAQRARPDKASRGAPATGPPGAATPADRAVPAYEYATDRTEVAVEKACHVTCEETTIAVVPVGYADGLGKAGGGWKAMLIHGQRAPVVAICMDMCMLDITHLGRTVRPGDPVTILGQQGQERITVKEASAWIGIFWSELLCKISTCRNPRLYVQVSALAGNHTIDEDDFSLPLGSSTFKVHVTNVYVGPNLYTSFPVIRLTVDLQGPIDTWRTDQGFVDGLMCALKMTKGGDHSSFDNCTVGMLVRDVLPFLTVGMQRLARANVFFGETRPTGVQGQYDVFFDYDDDEMKGREAAMLAYKLILNLLPIHLREMQSEVDFYKSFDCETDLHTFLSLAAKQGMGSANEALIKAAKTRKIPYCYSKETGHLYLGQGQYKHCMHEGEVIDELYPSGAPVRPLIAAVTGTNGKTTTTQIVAHILTSAGHSVGTGTTIGVYSRGMRVNDKDMANPDGAKIVLNDPLVDTAVLEVTRIGILQSGLGFPACEVAACTNVASDHLGEYGINTVKQMAEVKRVLLQAATKAAVLNADNSHSREMAKHTKARHVIFFTMNGDNSTVRKHVEEGSPAIVLEKGTNGEMITLYDNHVRTPLMLTHEIPATLNGLAAHNVANAMTAAALTYGMGKSPDDIRQGLSSFSTTFSQAPGRMNFYREHPFTVMLDYPHNGHAMSALAKVVDGIDVKGLRRLVLAAPGRRDEDIREFARAAAGHFDHYILRADDEDELRGRGPDEVPKMLRNTLVEEGVPEETVELITDESEAVDAMLKTALPDDFVVIIVDRIEQGWEQVINFKPTFAEHM